jgi:hypothetical protein
LLAAASAGLKGLGYTVTRHHLYIDGEFVAAESAATIEVIDPARAARTAFDDGPWKPVRTTNRLGRGRTT